MQRSAWTRFLTKLAFPLAMLLWVAGVPNAFAGDEYKDTSTSDSGWTSTSEHSHGGRVDSADLSQGEFYKSTPSKWSTSSEKTYFQDGKGEVKAKDNSGVPVGVVLYKDTGEANVWKGETEGWAGKASLATIGADYTVTGKVGKKDGNYYAEGKVGGSAYLLKAKVESAKLGVGDDNLGLHLQAKGDAMVGADGSLTGTAKVGKDGVALEAKAEVFAGAKANGQIPLTLSICKMKATGQLKGNVSAGAGASASGSVVIDWAKGTAKISGELAATLGLGAGAGVDVEIDISQLIKDPSSVANCLVEGVKELASAAVELGGDLVDAAGDALVTAGTAIANGTKRAANAVGSAVSSAGSAIASFFGWGSDPAPPIPPVRPGNNAPLRSNTRPVTITIMIPTGNNGRPSPTRSLKAHRQAYPH